MPRRMVLYALPGGRLLVYSAVAVDEATLATILKLGTPAVLCVPNRFHRLKHHAVRLVPPRDGVRTDVRWKKLHGHPPNPPYKTQQGRAMERKQGEPKGHNIHTSNTHTVHIDKVG